MRIIRTNLIKRVLFGNSDLFLMRSLFFNSPPLDEGYLVKCVCCLQGK